MKLKLFTAAIVLALGAPAMAAECTGDGTHLGNVAGVPVSFASECFRTFSSPVARFTDHYSFSISALGNVTGGLVNFLVFNWNDVSFNSVALTGAGYSGIDTNPTDGFTFADLAVGTYDLAVSGRLARGDYFGGYTGAITSTASIAAPVPEPETYAMALLGLAGVGFATRRHNKA